MQNCSNEEHLINNLVSCNGYTTMCLLFFEIYNRGFQHAGNVEVFKHVTHYGPLSGFPNYQQKTPDQEGSPYMPHGDALRSSEGLSPGILHQYQEVVPESLIFQIHFSLIKRGT